MSIIETCPAFSSSVTPSCDGSVGCVSDPLHAVVGSWLGPVVQPANGRGGPAPRPAMSVRCDDFIWR